MAIEEVIYKPILFEKDWNYYPRAIVDTKTTNESFLRMARLYKEMGVRNHAWPLALLHPALQGVDPFSPDLTAVEKVLIRLECTMNPWYVYREIMRLPGSGNKPIRYRANRGNLAMMFAYFCHMDAALIQPRQTHKSGSTDCLWIDIMDLRATNTTIYLITKDAQLRQANIERLKGIRSYIPDYLHTVTREDTDNQQELTNKFRNNKFRTGVGRSSESSANNLGRGMTAANFHNDEGPFTPWIGVTLEAALASGTAARLQAQESGQPYGNIFTTTAGKKDSRDGRYMYHLIHSGAVMNEKYFDAADAKEFEEMVVHAGRSDKALLNITLSHRQLGYTDEWLFNAMANAMRNPEATKEGVERDFLNRWSSGSLSSPLTAKLNDIILESVVDPSHTEITPERYTIRWYIPEDSIEEVMNNGHFALGADTSEAIGRDATAYILTDLRDLRTVAAFTINESNLLNMGNALANFMIRWRRVTLVMEKKSSAQALVDILIVRFHAMGIDPFRRIFNRIVDEKSERHDQFMEIQRNPNARSIHFYDPMKSYFGFNTTATSRQTLFGPTLQEAAKTAGHVVFDKTLSSEIRELVMKNDRIDHKESGHDDHVIAWLLTHWFVRYARNLSHYGIDMSYVMQDVTYFDQDLSPEEGARRERQKAQMAEVEALVERLRGIKDPIMALKMEGRLKQLAATIDHSLLGDEMNLGQLIETVNQERNVRRKMGGNNGRIEINSDRFYSGY